MKGLLAVVIFSAALAASPASAAPESCAARHSPQWIAVDAAMGKAEALGYAVEKAKRSKGCWKIEGYDRHGAEIEIYFDGASGDVIKPARWRPPASQ